MYGTSRSPRLVAALLSLTMITAACGDTDSAGDDGDAAFCAAMEQVAGAMAPDDGATPDAVRANFEEAVEQLEVAEQNAPAAIADDVTEYTSAIGEYVAALAEVDYDISAMFSTPEGAKLAEDTSHALTPAVVDQMTGPCGITLE